MFGADLYLQLITEGPIVLLGLIYPRLQVARCRYTSVGIILARFGVEVERLAKPQSAIDQVGFFTFLSKPAS